MAKAKTRIFTPADTSIIGMMENTIALCDKNNAHWAISFFAAFSYGAVVVPILSEFSIGQIQNIYEHSDSSLIICGEKYARGLKARILNISDFTMKDEPLAIDMTAFTDLKPDDVSYFRERRFHGQEQRRDAPLPLHLVQLSLCRRSA